MDCRFYPNVFMTSVVLFFGTFAIATTSLKRFKGAGGVIDKNCNHACIIFFWMPLPIFHQSVDGKRL